MTGKTNVQVLVVDDRIDAAETFAGLIKDTTGLECYATDNPAEAVGVAERNMVLVVVLDQRMPEKDGISLFQDLRKVAPNIEAIMLTAEAKISEASLGLSVGFDQVLAKSDVDQLPERVRNLYYTKLARITSRPVMDPVELVAEHRRFGIVRTPSVSLVGFTILDEDYVNDGEWETYLQLTVGEKRSDEITFKITHAFTLEQNSKTTLQSSLGAKGLKALEAKLDSEITSEIGITDNRETSLTSKTTVSYELPPRPTDSSTFIQARNYQYAPTYRRVRLEVERNCHACGSNERSIVIALFATGRFATRHEEFLNTNDKQVKPTGFVRLGNLQQVSGGA